MFTYVIVTGDDTTQSIKCCKLRHLLQLQYMEDVSLVAVYTIWTLLVGVIPMLVFPICGYDDYSS